MTTNPSPGIALQWCVGGGRIFGWGLHASACRQSRSSTFNRTTLPPFPLLPFSHPAERFQVPTVLAAIFPFVLAFDFERLSTIMTRTEPETCTSQAVYKDRC